MIHPTEHALKITAVRQAIAAMKQRQATERAGLEARLTTLRRECPHVNTEYWPDPSGNNGGGHDCLDCGADLPRGWSSYQRGK